MGDFVNTLKKWGIPFLWGMTYAALVILLSQVLLRNLYILVAWVAAGPEAAAQIAQSAGQIADTVFTASTQQDTTTQIIQAAGQLKTAVLGSPWLVALLSGGLIGLLMRATFRKPKARLWVSIAAGTLLLIPFTVLAIGFTAVNSVRVLELLQAVLPLFL